MFSNLGNGTRAKVLAGLLTVVTGVAGYIGKDWFLTMVSAGKAVPEIRQEQAVAAERLKGLERRVDDQDRKLDRINEGVDYLVRRELEKSQRARR